jgi:hypothetical protein
MFLIRVETLVFIAINVSICLLCVFFRLWDGDSELSNVMLLQSYGIASLIVIHSYAWFRQGGSDMSLAYLFFLMVFIFNAGKAILFIFFFELQDTFFNFFNHKDYQIVVRAFEYSYVGLLVIPLLKYLVFCFWQCLFHLL